MVLSFTGRSITAQRFDRRVYQMACQAVGPPNPNYTAPTTHDTSDRPGRCLATAKPQPAKVDYRLKAAGYERNLELHTIQLGLGVGRQHLRSLLLVTLGGDVACNRRLVCKLGNDACAVKH